MVSTSIPDIAFSATAVKYNPTDKVILSSTVTTIGDAWITWSSADFNSTEFSKRVLTSIQYQIPTGDTIAELAIRPNTLVADASYTFILSGTYSTSNPSQVDKFEQVVIRMNAPPAGGVMVVVPSEGVALNTTFTFETFDWIDDPDDYPLVYVMKTYSDAQSKTTIKTSGEVTYTSAVLGQGQVDLNYTITTEATAADTYGASATVVSSLRVTPVVDTAALAAAMESQLADSFANSDPVAVSQVVNAVSAALNVINCTVPVGCDTLNREKCFGVPQTCGTCKTGFIGIDGDANFKCSDPNEIFKLGEACPFDDKCSSNYCNSGICSERDKKCKNDCSGHGSCRFVDTTDNAIIYSTCGNSDNTCFAECQNCTSGYFGADCGMSSSAFDTARSMRAQLCNSIYSTVAIQDVSADVVSSRSSTLSSLLSSPDQLTTQAVIDCATALGK